MRLNATTAITIGGAGQKMNYDEAKRIALSLVLVIDCPKCHKGVPSLEQCMVGVYTCRCDGDWGSWVFRKPVSAPVDSLLHLEDEKI